MTRRESSQRPKHGRQYRSSGLLGPRASRPQTRRRRAVFRKLLRIHFGASRSLRAGRPRSQQIAHFLLSTAFCSLPSALCLLLSAYCLPPLYRFCDPSYNESQPFRAWTGSSKRQFPHVDDPQLEFRIIQVFGHHCFSIRHLYLQSYF